MRCAQGLSGLACCLILLLLACCKTPASEIDPFIPPDAVFVAFARPNQCLNSSLIKSRGWDSLLKTLIATQDPVQGFLENAGLNPFTQIDSVLIASTVFPILPTGDPEVVKNFKPDFIVALRGKFHAKNLLKALKIQGHESGAPVKEIQEGEFTLWVLPVPDSPVYVGISSKQKAVFLANRKKDVVGCLRGGFTDGPGKELRDALGKLQGKESAYLAGTIPKTFRDYLKKDNDAREFADKLDAWTVSAEITDKLEGTAFLTSQDNASVRQVKDYLEKKAFPPLKAETGKEKDQKKLPEKPPEQNLEDRIQATCREFMNRVRFAIEPNTLNLRLTLEEKLLDMLQGNQPGKP